MASGKVASYSDELLVQRLACGTYTHEEIAGELGLSVSYVGKVARAERRPELWVRVQIIREGMMAEARHLAAREARALMNCHIQEGLAGGSELARRCREFVLKTCCLVGEDQAISGSPAERWVRRLRWPGSWWGDVQSLFGPPDEGEDEGFTADSTGRKAKGLFSRKTSGKPAALRADARAGDEAQDESKKEFAAAVAGGKENVSGKGTL